MPLGQRFIFVVIWTWTTFNHTDGNQPIMHQCRCYEYIWESRVLSNVVLTRLGLVSHVCIEEIWICKLTRFKPVMLLSFLLFAFIFSFLFVGVVFFLFFSKHNVSQVPMTKFIFYCGYVTIHLSSLNKMSRWHSNWYVWCRTQIIWHW